MEKNHLIILLLTTILLGCSKNGDTGNSFPTEDQLAEDIENRFSFTPNQNFEALYLARRIGSGRNWYFSFNNNGTLDVLVTTDTNDDFSFRGSYTYQNDQITIQMPAGINMPFPQGLNETSTIVMPQMGLVAAFATDQMIAVCVGHGFNAEQPPRPNANYSCPDTGEENNIELVHTAVPFSFPVEGSIFRQNRRSSGIITRGYGIYRQTGDRYYATFRIAEDFSNFARGRLPANIGDFVAPFEDFNLMSGRISSDGQELTVDQLQPDQGPCRLR